jgi:HAMP domain-containing protein
LKGDIERISLYVSTARDAANNSNWLDAISQLQNANKDVDTALGRKLRMREEFEALKAAIDRTIDSLERRDKSADSQLAELQVRIGAIKTNTP